MIKKAIGAGIIAGMVLFAIFHQLTKEEEAESTAIAANTSGLAPGILAPSFTLTDLDGEEVKMEDYRGKKLVLNFWATWCAPCKAEMPAMEKLYQNYSGKFEILAVNLDPVNDVAGFANKNDLSFPILLDENKSVQNQYSVLSIPTTYIIDAKGIIVNKHIGSMTYEQLEEYIK
jgi:peroxiredoxin